ncbi:MAG: tripartite tricarboxylate transporter TctB family protein [Synergistaceae bacterium]|nr:tripartite tricarboxylate transporter TctB family protein [Synergistaceae bacterium]
MLEEKFPEERPGDEAVAAAETPERKSSVILGAALILICVFVWLETAGYPDDLLDARKMTGPGTLPRLLSLILGLVGVWESARAFRTGSWRFRVDWSALFFDPRNRNIRLVIVMTGLWIPLTQYLGFTAGSMIYVLSLMVRLKAKPWLAVVCSCLAVAFVVVVFNYVFRVQLPMGILTEPLGWRH